MDQQEITKLLEEEEKDDFKPREYQVELLEIALKQNSILYLPTGSGKTFIATMLIKELSKVPNTLEKKFSDGGKLSFFLVNTVTLVLQQSKRIRRASHFRVGEFYGDLGVDFWSKETWQEQFDNFQVLVMTSQIFLNLLQTNVLKLSQVNLIVFDECHHSTNHHPMRQIMQCFQYTPKCDQPRILGLTATLLNSNVKPKDVENEISNLETTLHSKIATASNAELVRLYSTNPVEDIIRYRPNNFELVPYKVCDSLISNLRETLDSIIFDPDISKIDTTLVPANSTPLKDSKKINKKIINILVDVQYNLRELGLYAGSKAALAHLVQVERLRLQAETQLLTTAFSAVATSLTSLRRVLELAMSSRTGAERIFEYSSPKVIKLLELLCNFKESNTALVFVKRRFTAKIMYYVLKDLKDMDERYKNIKPDFMVGFNSNPFNDTREGFLQKKWNREVMARFDSGDVNVLCASDVVEEGMDIQLCNLVIKFDKPNDFRSYVQSKGRARSKTSQFYLFKCEDDQKFTNDHGIFRLLEGSLKQTLGAGQSLTRTGPDEETIKKSLYDDVEPGLEPFMPAGPDGPMINAVSSISIVNSYCALLAIDRFSRVCPVWSLIKKDRKVCGHLVMPMESKVKGEIWGEPMPNKIMAKQSVALETCKALYKAGELNPLTLLPVGRQSEVINDRDLVPNWTADPPTEKKKSRFKKYNKIWPDCLSNCRPTPNTTLYVHLLRLKPVYTEPPDNRRRYFYHLLQSDCDFGILSTKKLPEVCSFPLYLNVGDLSGQIVPNVMTAIMSQSEIRDVINFHSLIFTRLMDLVKTFMMRDYYNRENSFLLVPLKPDLKNGFEIDWETISTNQNVPDVIELSNEERINLEVTEASYLGAVVCPYYRTMFPYMNYIVTRVCHELDEHSPFPSSEYESYADYFRKKYDITLYCSNQSLLEVRAISSKINCLKPRSVSKQRRKRNNEDDDFEETLVAELCVKFNFPAVYWLKATVLPSILHRLNQFLIAEELRVKIAQEINVGQLTLQNGETWDTLVLDKTTVIEEKSAVQEVVPKALAPRPKKLQVVESIWGDEQEPMDLEREIEKVNLLEIFEYNKFVKKPASNRKMEQTDFQLQNSKDVPPKLQILEAVPEGHIGPQQCEIMQALTAACSNDIVQNERLETLGDCFLKFATSLSLYTHYPELTEGELTQIKSKVVGNKNLFDCAQIIKLGSMIKVNEFSPKEDWVPPGFCVHPEIQKIIITANLSPRVLFHLTVPPNESVAGKLSPETIQNMMDEILERGDDDDMSSNTNTNFISIQLVADKTVSDAVEALIGVYLKSCGVKGALRLMKWFGIMKRDLLDDNIFTCESPKVLLGSGGSPSVHLLEPNKLQDILGYQFRDNAYILHALSHPSYSVNLLTKCYQRLEFLGDAVIDFLITCHIYEKCGNLTPGDLTDLRSALVNNITLACLTVRYGLHKFLLARSCLLDDAIMRFVRHQEDHNYIVDDDVLFLREETDVKFAESVDVPKVLGDIFESLIGAIYLDSGKDLNVTWTVLYNFMKKEIEQFSAKVPKNHVRQLYELTKDIKFLQSEVIPENSMVMVPLEVIYECKLSTFVGFGDNKKKAKRAAAKLALRHIYHLDK